MSLSFPSKTFPEALYCWRSSLLSNFSPPFISLQPRGSTHLLAMAAAERYHIGVPCGVMETLCSFLQISRNMCQGNQSTVSEFLFLGLSDQAEQQKLLFVLFLGMYLATVVGNRFIILAISFNSYFHTPMYLFLANLSFADISSISTPIPKMLINIQTNSQSISPIQVVSHRYTFPLRLPSSTISS